MKTKKLCTCKEILNHALDFSFKPKFSAMTVVKDKIKISYRLENKYFEKEISQSDFTLIYEIIKYLENE